MVSGQYILNSYGISKEWGFLSQKVIDQLPSKYAVWEEMANQFTDLLNANTFREKLEAMPIIREPMFQSKEEWERAMLLLSYFGHAYVFGWDNPVAELPESIAVPWVKIADKLGRKPVLSHASAVLNNWKLIDKTKPFAIENIATRIQFQGSIDESWFFMITALIEKNGAAAIAYSVDAILAVEKDDEIEVEISLEEIHKVLREIIQNLKDMRLHCDPYIFFNRLRPFLSSFENIHYKGTENSIQSFHGGSAAQSSLIQMFDAVFGIRHHSPYLKEMRDYMPPKHVEFLKFLEFKSKLKSYCNQNKSLEKPFQECMDALLEFRNEHLKIAAEYIMGQKPKSQEDIKGTGGTNPMVFLKGLRDKTKQ